MEFNREIGISSVISVLLKKYKVYSPFAISVFKTRMAYKTSFYFEIISKVFEVFITFFLWKSVFLCSKSSILEGFDMSDMITYIFISYVASNIIYIDVSNSIGGDVVEGTIAVNLVKPIDYRLKLFVTSIGSAVYRFFVPSFIIWCGLEIYKYFVLDMGFTNIVNIISFVLSCLLSFVIYFLFDFCFGMLSFVSSYVWGMVIAKTALLSFLSGQLIPLAFYPEWAQKLLLFLPFSSMNYTPVMIYIGKIQRIGVLKAYGLQVFWIIVLWLVSSLLWKHVINKVTIAGG